MKYWLLAIRPKTLFLSLNPVLLGILLVYAEGFRLDPVLILVICIVAISLQIAVNLHNDALDHIRGVDDANRLGPPRACAQGWLKPEQLLKAFYLFTGIALVLGLYLVYQGGWPFLWLGLIALLLTWLYSSTPLAISRWPIGEWVVFLFFGPVALSGTYYLFTHRINPASIWLGTAIGLLAAAVLLVNNYRDRQSDCRAGRKTSAVLLSRHSIHFIYAFLLLLPLFLPLNIGIRHSLLLAPVALYLIDQMMNLADKQLNGLLFKTVLFQCLYVLVIGLALYQGNESTSLPDTELIFFWQQS